jgi:hypothetical protein
MTNKKMTLFLTGHKVVPLQMNQWNRITKKWERIKDQMILSVRCCERQRIIGGKGEGVTEI